MLFLLTSRVRPGLSAGQFGELAALAKSFYASIPTNVSIRGEWVAIDRSANYSLVEAPDIDAVGAVQLPFAPFTQTEIVPVNAITGWTLT
jgi:hypothetical protein